MSDALIEAVARGLYAQWPNQFKETRPTTMVEPAYETVWVSESWEDMIQNTPSRRLELLDAARAALSAIEAAGWRVVPVEPTQEMIEAGLEGEVVRDSSGTSWRSPTAYVYSAMLSAAPRIGGEK